MIDIEREREMEGEGTYEPAVSPEIVEIGESSRGVTVTSNRDVGVKDVYVAVGKGDDLAVLKWALDHVVSPGANVFLVHVFPSISYINTPVGKLSKSQLSGEQVRFYINEEDNRRRNLLQKYISLCNDAKVSVDTMIIESSATAKAILELIPILNISLLVMGTKRPFSSRKGLGKGAYVQKNAPECCEVIIIYHSTSKKIVNCQKKIEPAVPSILESSHQRRSDVTPQSQRNNFFDCICFSGKSS